MTPEQPAVDRERLPAVPDALPHARVRDSRHRLMCRRCNRTEEVGGASGGQLCLTRARDTGFMIDEVEVVFLGLCPGCRAD